MIRYAILFFFVFFCNCRENNEKYDFKLAVREIRIPISYEQLPFYPVATVLRTDSSEIFIGFNYAYNSIDFFDLRTSRFLHKIKIESDGPQSATNLSQLYAGQKFMIASSPPLVYKINYQGEILKKYNYDTFAKDGLDGYTLDPDIQISNFKQLCYDEKNDFIIKNLFSVKQKLDDAFYAKSLIFCKVYLEQAKIESIPIGYPPAFNEDVFFGDLDTPYGFYANDSLIYNFPAFSKVFIHTDNHVVEKELNPMATPKQSPPIIKNKYVDIQERLRHYLTSSQFFGLVRHYQFPFLLRIHKDYTEKVGLDNSKNFLMFISQNLNKSYEVPISQKFNPIPFPVKDGIVFQEKPTKGENYLVLQQISMGSDLINYLMRGQ